MECSRYSESGRRSTPVRKNIFKKLEEVLDTDAIIATNGSTIIISELAAELDHKERCVSLYFPVSHPDARILVTGPASQPEITFTSEPTLPQDEVLARLLFGRNAGSLTAAQSLQIAQTIAQFSGGGGGVLDQMRRSLGMDSLDVGTNSAGTGGQVGLGRRINERIYMGVQQGTTPNSSQVTVDVDVTKNIRLQGATGANGNTSVGIGAQWDY